MNNFYVYGHYRNDTGELFYIGKGSRRRAWETAGRNPYWKNVVNKHGIVVKILHENLTDEQAYQKEKELIEDIGLDNLANLIEGGVGMTSADAKRLAEERKNHPTWLTNQFTKNKKLAEDSEWRKKVSAGVKNSYDENPDRCKAQSDRTKKLLESSEYRKKLEDTKEHVKKKVVLISPTGDIVYVHGIKKFAREYGLDYTRVARLVRGERKSHKGWKIYIPSNDTHLLNQFTL
jgi:hypothetical protein